MAVIISLSVFLAIFLLAIAAWRRYLWVLKQESDSVEDSCPYSLTEVFSDRHLISVPHQKGVRWLTDVFSRSAVSFLITPPCRFPTRGSP